MHSTTLLADLVHRKHHVLAQLVDAGRQQREIVDQGETSALLKLLASKQTMIAALQQIERDIKPFYEEDPDARVWSSAEARAACAAKAAECNRLLAEILELERSSADRMTVRRNEVAAQLQHVYAAGQARSAYEAHR
jgi:flagellar biosynthesis/type III secretory pathway chaperone